MIRVLETRMNPFSNVVGNGKHDDHNEFLDPKGLEYQQKNKNRTGDIVYMSPSEYFEMCAEMFRQTQNPDTSVQSLKRSRGEYDRDSIEKYMADMKKGDKFDIPYISFADGSQEGLHRMFCIGELYGWDTEVPVLVIEPYNKELEEESVAIKCIDNLKYWMKQGGSECNASRIAFNVARDFNYELTEECIDKMTKQFEEGCKAEDYNVKACIDTDIDANTIQFRVLEIKYINRKKMAKVPEEYQVVFEDKLSEYFNGIVDEEEDELELNTDAKFDDDDDIIDKLDDLDWEEFNKIGLDDRSVDNFMKKMKKKHGGTDTENTSDEITKLFFKTKHGNTDDDDYKELDKLLFI